VCMFVQPKSSADGTLVGALGKRRQGHVQATFPKRIVYHTSDTKVIVESRTDPNRYERNGVILPLSLYLNSRSLKAGRSSGVAVM